MADNDVPFNFSITDTMEMGLGNAELLNDLLSPETATADAEKLEEIVKQVEDKPIVKEEKQKGKEIVQKGEGEELTGQDLVSNFLGDNESEEEPPEKKPLIKEEEEEEPVSQYSALHKDLVRIGFFTTEEGEQEPEIKTPEEFLDRFNAEKKKGAVEMVDKFIAQFGQDYQDAFDAIYVKGVSPRDYFSTYNTIANFAELDLADENNQVAVIKQALTDQGMEPEDVASEVERLKNYGDLETVAAKHHKVLVKKEALKLQQMEQKAEQEMQQRHAVKQQYIQNVQHIIEEKLKTKEFDGIPINPKLANELQDFLLTDKWKTVTGETITDFDRAILEMKRPENHNMKVKVALLLKILEKDPTLSTIQKSGITKKSDQLFGEVVRQQTKRPVVPGTQSNIFNAL